MMYDFLHWRWKHLQGTWWTFTNDWKL